MEEGYLGEVRIFAGARTPRGWANCDGGALLLSDNQPLHAILGNTFGGTSGGTRPRRFFLPRIPDPGPGMKYIVCVSGIFPQNPH